jgi:hypothetical protein
MQHYLLASTVQHLTRLIHLQHLENTRHCNKLHADSAIRDIKNVSTYLKALYRYSGKDETL